MLSEKDLKISMRNVTSAWYEGRVFKHPETGNMVHFWALPKDERNRLNQMVHKKQVEESQPSVPGVTPVSPSKKPKQIRPKILKRKKPVEEPKKKPKVEDDKDRKPKLEEDKDRKAITVDGVETSRDAEKLLDDNGITFNQVLPVTGEENGVKWVNKGKTVAFFSFDKKQLVYLSPEKGGRTQDFDKLKLEKIPNVNSLESAKNVLRGKRVEWKSEEPVKDAEGNIAEIHFKDEKGKLFGYWLMKRKELVLNNRMVPKKVKEQPKEEPKKTEPKPVPKEERPKKPSEEYFKSFMEQVKAEIPPDKNPEQWHEPKDAKRIADILAKAKGDSGKEGRLAVTMANRIGGAFKAFRRYNAAKAAGNKNLAFIFHERFLELAKAGIFKPGVINRQINVKPKDVKKPKDVEEVITPKFDNPVFNTERDKKMKKMKVLNVVNAPGGGINQSFKIKFEDNTSGCFKPKKAMRYGTPNHEVFASGLNRFLGFTELVPPTTIRSVAGRGMGSVQEWKEDMITGDVLKRQFGSDYKSSNISADELAQSWMMDLLMLNTDRHNLNWLVDKEVGKDGKRHMYLIDNGLCLTKGRPFKVMYWHLNKEDRPKFDKLVDRLETLGEDKFKKTFNKILKEKEMKMILSARKIIINKRDQFEVFKDIETLQYHWGEGEDD